MRNKMFYVLLLVLLILTAIALAFKKVFEQLDEKEKDTNVAPIQPSILYVPSTYNDSSLQSKISELENLTEIALTAGENIAFGKVVAIQNGTVYLFDPTDEDMFNLPIGIAKTSAVSGNLVKVALSGRVSGFESLIPNKKYYSTSSGEITTLAPQTGSLRSVGIALNTKDLFIDFSQNILQ